jgi:four helix bundle protein
MDYGKQDDLESGRDDYAGVRIKFETRNSKFETNSKFQIPIPKAEVFGYDSDNMTDDLDEISHEEEVFWGGLESSLDHVLREESTGKPAFNLEERTAQFGEAVIRFAKKVPETAVTTRLITQLVGAATSVGANYCEANDCVSKKDFKKSIGTCRKEAKETRFFLRMIASAEPALKHEARIIWKEAKELNLIFGAIWRKP